MPTSRTKWIGPCILASVMLIPSRPAASQGQSETTGSSEISVGSETEGRFPPLVVPQGFKSTLFACDPLIEYPSVIALGPRAGTLFVAHDYVTGLGVEIVRRDELRLIEDTEQDGYADRSTVFAKDFNSIQGLASHDGTVFVMHAPTLTALRDTDRDGVADERRDLIHGLGLPPEKNDNRLHCANGVTAGHDGWLYLALGDRGCDVQRPEGDRLLFQQGGILRCRLDGSDLHVFASGLRNIYDVALDAELNVFVRDNENDGGDYMIRVCHCFFGSDHGYPYHYYERPDEPMPPLADLGRGSSAGGTSYLETAFPQEFRASLFFCEWGRAVVRYQKSRAGSSFNAMSEIDFAAGASDDPYGFKPTDLVVDHDGSLLISDWADGQRPKRGRGRIYRISYVDDKAPATRQASRAMPHRAEIDTDALVDELDSTSHQRRLAAQLQLERRGAPAVRAVKAAMEAADLAPIGRLHGVWIVAHSGSQAALDELFAFAESDTDVRVRAQAIRAIGDLTDPILVEGRVQAGRGDDEVGNRIATLARTNADPRIVLESLIVLRRLRWRNTPQWIAENLSSDEPAVNHAATQALRHAQNWPAVAGLLDGPLRLRRLALHAIAEQREPYVANELIQRLETADDSQHRREYADALSRIVRQLGPWKYWGFRPAPRPAATVEWAQTPAILEALNARLQDPDFAVRAFVLQRMLREAAVAELPKLADWLRAEFDEDRQSRILDALDSHDANLVQPILIEIIARRTISEKLRVRALTALVTGVPEEAGANLVELVSQLEDGPVLGAALRELGKRPKLKVDAVLLQKSASAKATVRAAAMWALGRRGATQAQSRVAELLGDEDREVRLAAAEAAGLLGAKGSADLLLTLAGCDDRLIVSASLDALRRLSDGRAVPVSIAALEHSDTQLAALEYLHEFGHPALIDKVVQAGVTNLSFDFQRELSRTLTAWRRRFPRARSEIRDALAEVHGQNGQPFAWQASKRLSDIDAADMLEQLIAGLEIPRASDEGLGVVTLIAENAGAEIRMSAPANSSDAGVWVAWSPVRVANDTEVEMLASSTGELSVWLNSNRVHHREMSDEYRLDSDRFPAMLHRGMNLIAVKVRTDHKAPRFHLRFRRRSSKEEHERLTQFALRSRGSPIRGRAVFEDVQKAACINCHQLGDRGGRVGPDLSGIGRRFSRIHLIESILDPSRTVAPSYSTVVVVLNSGRVVSGVRVSESEEVLVIGDNQGKLHEIQKHDIDEIASRKESTMPEAIDKALTDREFTDLLSFLESQKSEK